MDEKAIFRSLGSHFVYMRYSLQINTRAQTNLWHESAQAAQAAQAVTFHCGWRFIDLAYCEAFNETQLCFLISRQV